MSPTLWPRWLQALAGAAILALAVWLFTGPIWKLFDWFNDREAVSDYQDKQTAKVATTVLEAERQANRNDTERRVVRERQDAALEDAITNAITENPDETSLPAGPATRAVLRELRSQAAGNSDPAG